MLKSLLTKRISPATQSKMISTEKRRRLNIDMGSSSTCLSPYTAARLMQQSHWDKNAEAPPLREALWFAASIWV
jgi:hypothetical protein